MGGLTWVLLLGVAGAIGYAVWRLLRNWQDRVRASEARMASLVAQALPKGGAQPAPAVAPAGAASPAPGPVPGPAAGIEGLAQQKLLFEAASKAAEAGETVLAIQLYARLLSRYPASGFAGQVRAAVEVLKKKIAKR